MNTYTSEKTLPYVYKVENILTGEFYIGYRMANKLPSNLDFPIYKTSSPKIKATFSEFSWFILAEFHNGDDAYDFEQLSIFEEWGNPLLLNKSCFHGKRKFNRNNKSPSIKTRLKVSKSLKGIKNTEQHNKNISIGNTGKTRTPEQNKRNSDDRKGKTASDKTKAKMSKSSKGKPKSEQHRLNMCKPKPKIKCPHCNKIGANGLMKRYHFDNCKLKISEKKFTIESN